jgi:myo-inositol-1-phosphate synthase
MEKIRVAIIGVGNCASALIQGIHFYRDNPKFNTGLMHEDIGGYKPGDIDIVAAIDVDARKVGKRLDEAIFSPPNCIWEIYKNIPEYKVKVSMGEILDGISEHMKDYRDDETFIPAKEKAVDIEALLKDSGAEICLNYLPVGSTKATQFYAERCLNTGVSFINCMPVFIASDPVWAKRFEDKGIPIIGDDVKSQVGATIVHRTLARLFDERGVDILHTYQLNVGGNTDFLNMLNRSRLKDKKLSKTEAVQSILTNRLNSNDIHIGPSDYVPFLKDNKVCFLRIVGEGFGRAPIEIELRLSVQDSPNSGGVTIDAIRCCKLARERKIAGVLTSISAYTMKHPPEQIPDYLARKRVEEFIAGKIER